MSKTIRMEQKVQSKSAEIARELNRYFSGRRIFVINLIGSPGSGKTSLLEAIAPHVHQKAAVIEGDLQTDEDKRRIESAGLPAYEINTINACHLDARMIQTALDEFPLGQIQYLFIENVGNLVCPAGFDLGEHCKVSVISTPEGDDKPAKYPTALRNSRALVITKTDLIPHVSCDMERMERDALATHPALKIFPTSATTGEGIESLVQWILQQAQECFHS